MDVVMDWEELISDLRRRFQNGDESCRLLLVKAEFELKAARDKKQLSERDQHGH